jgi:hypothetical protein
MICHRGPAETVSSTAVEAGTASPDPPGYHPVMTRINQFPAHQNDPTGAWVIIDLDHVETISEVHSDELSALRRLSDLAAHL